MIPKADWESQFMLMEQIISVCGIFGYGFVTSWVFGREYADKTLKDLLALPISRTEIVLAKFAVVLVASSLLSILMFAASMITGVIVGLGELSLSGAVMEFFRYETASLLLILVCTPVAFFANLGRGFMLPLGVIFVFVILAQFVGVLGLAPFFPWAIPALYLEGEKLSMLSYAILIATSGLGIYLTQYWWNHVDL